jgi:N-methylhydantoinase A
VHFAEANGWIDCPIFARSSLSAGSLLDGPAIVEQLDTTVVIMPGQIARTDEVGNLLIVESAR